MPMTVSIKPRSARSVATVGAIGIFALVVPLQEASSQEEALTPASANVDFASIPRRFHFPSIAIRRNPFVEPSLQIRGPASGELDEDDIVLPPNAGAPAPIVRAVISGTVPKALVEVAGRTAIVGMGSRLAGSTVIQISSDAVRLENGVRLLLPQNQP